jgi:hypothetical protein
MSPPCDQLRLAQRWGLSTATLERCRSNGIGPKLIRLPGKVIFHLCDIEAYENDCLISSTADFRKNRRTDSTIIYQSSLPNRSRV